jgi:hypothetical protein
MLLFDYGLAGLKYLWHPFGKVVTKEKRMRAILKKIKNKRSFSTASVLVVSILILIFIAVTFYVMYQGM